MKNEAFYSLKRVILIISLCLIKAWFCPLCTYGQSNPDPDLIVKTTGDSIQCRILNIDDDGIHYRLGSGNLMSIPQKEVASYALSHFALPYEEWTTGGQLPPKVRTHVFYFMVSAGTTDFGSVSFGDAGGLTFHGGFDAAFYLQPWLKAGLKFNAINAAIDFGKKYTYSDRVMLIAPALYGSFGKKALKMDVCASFGIMNWRLSNQKRYGIPVDNKSSNATGCYFSIGLTYMFIRNFGIGLNVHTIQGKLQDEAGNMERNPSGMGGSFGLVFSF